MKTLAMRINEIRSQKGFSQDTLAELSGLNLRTIQRIEKGETTPRGDSLQRLSKALGTSPEELIDCIVKEDKSVLYLLNLSQLSFLAFPLLGIFIPMAIWILQKDKVSSVTKIGKSILNFQLTWTLVFLIFSGPVLYLKAPIMPAAVFVVGTGFLYAYNLMIIVTNALFISRKKQSFYEPSIKFLGQ
ncbi:MAG: helix-turn-helix domain-containing protein [Cyclobacteriaceae bacterium]